MNKSESIKEIAAALCKAQSEMSGAKKGAINPHFKKAYADMGSVVEAVKIPFADNGLSYAQFPVFEDSKIGVETILMHSSGEWLSGKVILPMVKQDPQAAGSALTYARRYALQSIAGIPSEDDDGNQASQASQAAPKQARPIDHSSVIKRYTDADQGQRDILWASINEDQRTAINKSFEGK
jgi:hypothetical protein